MKSTDLKQTIATDLIQLLSRNCSIKQISSWAEGVYSLHCREFDPETEEIIIPDSAINLEFRRRDFSSQ